MQHAKSLSLFEQKSNPERLTFNWNRARFPSREGEQMTTVREAHFEATLLGDLLTVVRGSQSFHIPVSELPELNAVIGQALQHTAPQRSGLTQTNQTVSVAPPRTGRRGKLWHAVRTHLSQQKRAQGYRSLLKYVKQQNLTNRNPNHALKIALGKKVASGELILTPSGRYTVPKPSLRLPPSNGASLKRSKRGDSRLQIINPQGAHCD